MPFFFLHQFCISILHIIIRTTLFKFFSRKKKDCMGFFCTRREENQRENWHSEGDFNASTEPVCSICTNSLVQNHENCSGFFCLEKYECNWEWFLIKISNLRWKKLEIFPSANWLASIMMNLDKNFHFVTEWKYIVSSSKYKALL